MTVTTIPSTISSGGPVAGAGSTSPTSPGLAGVVTPDAVATVVSGVATQYWAELLPIPAAQPRLWLLVANGWRLLASASALQFDQVQQAFLGTDSTVTVWYDGSSVVGLVVSGS